MLIAPISTVNDFVDGINRVLNSYKPSAKLTLIQLAWLRTVIIGIIVTEKFCWAVFERRSLGNSKANALRWMFYRAKISWHLLLQASVCHIIKSYSVDAGVLAIDDSDKKRSKITSRIPNAHKIKDKTTGGYMNGQEMLFMVLITDCVTIPIDFCFYTPDPELSKWRKVNKQLKKQGVPAKDRPARPKPNDSYPSKQTVAAKMVNDFTKNIPRGKSESHISRCSLWHSKVHG